MAVLADDEVGPDGNVVYVTISVAGEIVAPAVPVAVTDLDGDGTFNVDEVLKCAHDQLYPGGAEAGYASSVGTWGLSLNMLWGDTSGNFGYYVDNALVITDLTVPVEAGGSVYAFVYADTEFWSDTLSYFDQTDAVAEDGTLTLTLCAAFTDEYSTVTVLLRKRKQRKQPAAERAFRPVTFSGADDQRSLRRSDHHHRR